MSIQTRERPVTAAPPLPEEKDVRPGWLDRPIVWLPAINREVLIFLALMAIGAALRFWDLGARAQHHDESLHALYSWYLYTGRGFQADPLMHGPFLFHAIALIYFLFGDSDYTSRVATAVFGTALIGLPYFLRSYLTRWGAIALAIFFLVSPSYLYYSRFNRQEASLLLFTLAIAIGSWRYLAVPKAKYLILIGLALGLSFADKATTYFTIAIFGGFFFLMSWRDWLAVLRRPVDGLKNLSPAGDVVVVIATLGLPQFGAATLLITDALNITLPTQVIATTGGIPITGTTIFAAIVVTILLALSALVGLAWNAQLWWRIAAAFYIPYFLLYTTFLTNLPGFGTGIWGMLSYWMEQHGVQRGNQPPYYFLILMSIYEFLPVILGVIGAIGVFRGFVRRQRADWFGYFLVFWAAASLIIYSSAGEKMPWLVVHPTLPFMLLAARTLGGWIGRFPVGLARDLSFWLVTLGGILGLIALGILISVALGTGPAAGNLAPALRVAVLLAALALIAVYVFRERRRLGASPVGRAALVALLVIGFGLTVRAAWQASYYHGDIPVEMLVYTQTSPDVPVLARRIQQAADLGGGRDRFPVTIDSTESFTWPWAWYLRDFQRVDYPNLASPTGPPIGTVLLVHASNVDKVQPFLDKYGPGQRYRLRWWFPEDYRGLDFARLGQLISDPNVWKIWWRYFLYRDLVNPLGSSDGVAFFPKELTAPLVAAAQPAPARPEQQLDPAVPSINPPVALTIGGQRGPAPGQLSEPKGIAVDGSGNLYVADSLNHRIQKFGPDGQLRAYAGSEGPGAGQFKEPWGIALDQAGNVYVADTWNHRIQKLDPNLNLVAQWGGFADAKGVLDAARGQFYGPRSVVVGHDGAVYVTDTGNKRIQKFSPDGEFLGAFGGSGSEPGKFQEPVGLAVDGAGNIYVADTWNRRIQKFDPSMTFLAAWPVPGWSSLSVVNKPYLAVAPDGLVYATDPENRRVFELSPEGQVKAVIGGPGGPALTLPIGVAVAPDGGLWVAEAGQHRVQKFDLTALPRR